MNDLLQRAIAAQGGADRWKTVRAIEADVSVSGLLWDIKGSPRGLDKVAMRFLPDTPHGSITPFAGGSGHFRPDRVWITDAEDKVIASRDNPRAAFDGQLMTKWDELGELYFLSYAMWNYFNTPFLLARPGVKTEDIGEHQEFGQTWRKLKAVFPDTIPTHSAEQTFYFDKDGLLRRQDYDTEILGGVASHYSFDHQTIDGIVFPTLRRVVRRTGAPDDFNGPTGVLLRIANTRFV